MNKVNLFLTLVVISIGMLVGNVYAEIVSLNKAEMESISGTCAFTKCKANAGADCRTAAPSTCTGNGNCINCRYPNSPAKCEGFSLFSCTDATNNCIEWTGICENGSCTQWLSSYGPGGCGTIQDCR